MKKSLCIFITVATLVTFFGSSANAFIKTYSSKEAYLADLTALSFLDELVLDFESQTAGSLILSGDTVDGVTFTYAINIDMIQVHNSFRTTTPANYIGLDNIEGAFIYGDALTMNFGQTVNAIGFYVIAEPGAVLVNDFELSTTAGSAFNSGTPDVVLSDGEAFFIGLIETDSKSGFSSAYLTGTLDPDLVNYVFNLDGYTSELKPVPAPSLPAILELLLLD